MIKKQQKGEIKQLYNDNEGIYKIPPFNDKKGQLIVVKIIIIPEKKDLKKGNNIIRKK